MRSDFEQRLETTDKEIADAKAQIDSLLKGKENAISAGDDATAVKSKHEVKALEERLEDLGIKKAAIQAKLQIYERNHKVAAKIRDEISTTWQQVGPLVDTLIQTQRTVTDTLTKIASLQTRIGTLAAKHIELTDESFDPPLLRLPREIQYFPNVQLSPLASWKFVSEEDRRAATAKREAEEQEAQATRVKVAVASAPLCPKCEQPMELRKEIGFDGESTAGSGRWSYTCRNCKIVTSEYVAETDLRKK